MAERVVMQMRVRQETKDKLDYLKKFNPDVPWDIILEPVIKEVLLPKPQSNSTKPPPIIQLAVKYPGAEEPMVEG